MSKMLVFLLLWMKVVAGYCADIVVVVHPSVPVKTASKAHISNLYFVSSATWPSGEPVVPFDMRGDVPLKTEFYQQVINRSITQVRAYRARQIFSGTGIPPMEVGSVAEMLRRIATTPGAIGYMPRDQVNDSVKVLVVSP